MKILLGLALLFLAACTPAMVHPLESQSEREYDYEYRSAKAVAETGDVSARIAAYEVCMMDRGHTSE